MSNNNNPRFAPLLGCIVRLGGPYGGTYYEIVAVDLPHGDIEIYSGGFSKTLSQIGWKTFTDPLDCELIRKQLPVR